MSRSEIKNWVVLGLISIFLLNACRFGESTGGENGGASGGRKLGDGGTLLFQGKAPDAEGIQWTYESGTERSAIGTLNPEVFAAQTSPLGKAGQRMVFNLFEGQEFVAIVDNVTQKSDTRFTAYGHIEGISDSHFITAVENGALSALIDLPETGKYRVVYARDGLYRVIKMNSFYPPLVPADKIPVVDHNSPGLGKVGTVLHTQVDTPTVTLAVFYTSVAAAAAGGTSAIEANIETAVGEANQAYQNSHIALKLDCVYKGQVTYTESGSMSTDLGRLRGNGDNYLDTVHTIRTAAGADLVVLVTLHDNSGYAGLGYLFSPPLNTSFSTYAFAVVLQPYLTGYAVMTHEMGHNMGCHHDVANATGAAAYSYSYGHKFVGSNGTTYRTIMAYPPGTLVNYFSNPDITYMGTATGTSTHNNALSINNTAAIVAAFMGDASPPTANMTYPLTGSTFTSPATVVLRSTPTDDGAIDKVEFYADGSKLSTDSKSPYSYASVFTTGSHTAYSIAYDLAGNKDTSSTVSFTVGASPLTAPWSDRYIGSSGITGSATNSSSKFRVISGGLNIGDKEDHFHFAYRTLSSSAKLVAKVDSLRNSATGCKAGLMLRDSLIPNSPSFFLGVNPSGTVTFESRANYKSKTTTLATAAVGTLPCFLMMMRKGNEISAYRSPDRSSWNLIKSVSYKSDSTMYMGLAVNSADSTQLDTAWFDSVSFATTVPNNPPLITLTGLFDGQRLNTNSVVTLKATASDKDGKVKKVLFYNGNTRLAIDSTSPYLLLDTLTLGTYSFKAKVVDDIGDTSSSNALETVVDSATTKVVYPTADATVRNGKYENTAYGTSALLTVRKSATAGSQYDSYLLFPISAVSSVTSATLRLYASATESGSYSVNVYGCDSLNWTEKTLKYSNKPTVGAQVGSFSKTTTAGEWIEIDITSLVSAKKTAGATSICLVLSSPSATVGAVTIPARTAAQGKPELVLNP